MDTVLSRRAWLGAAGATAAAAALGACGSSTQTASTTTVTVPVGVPITTEAARPDVDGPDAALELLRQGNQRFATSKLQHPHQGAEARLRVSKAQQPFAVVLSCSDSRLPPEVIFDQGLGDLFVVRVAGNILDGPGLGSLEFAVTQLGTPLIVVLGHVRCGALAATLNETKVPGHILSLVDAIRPAVQMAKGQPGDPLDNAIRANIRKSVEDIRGAQPILADLVRSGKLDVAGALYDLDTGKVELLR